MADKWVDIEGYKTLISGPTYDALMNKNNKNEELTYRGKRYEARQWSKADLIFPAYHYSGVAFVEVES